MKLDLLAFGAHPDDVELGCGGVIAKAVAEGKKVGIVDLTKGELSSRGNLELRAKESEAAAEILGVSFRKNLNFKDGFISNDQIHQLELISILREHTPKVVLCNAVKRSSHRSRKSIGFGHPCLFFKWTGTSRNL